MPENIISRVQHHFMTDKQIISWIFLAIALGSQKINIGIKEISEVADGINHAVPTKREIKLAIEFLLKEEIINKDDKKYSLSKKGHIIYNAASLNTTVFSNICKNVERQLKGNL